MAWAAVVAGGTALIGGVMGSRGASAQAEAQIKAGRDAQKLYDNRTGEGMGNMLRMLYGADARSKAQGLMGQDQFGRTFGRPASEAVAAANKGISDIDLILAKYGKAAHKQPIIDVRGTLRGYKDVPDGYDKARAKADGVDIDALIGQKKQHEAIIKGGDAGQVGLFDPSTDAAAGPGMLNRMQELFGQYDTEAKGLQSKFGADTQALLGQGDAQLQEARMYGRDRQAQAQQDADRMAKSLNAQTKARMQASGIGGGTTEAQQMQGNTMNIYDALQRQRAAIGDQSLQLSQGIRGQNLGMQNQRALQGSAMDMNLLQRSQELRQQPLQTEMQMLTGNIMNPYLGQNTTQYFPGVSASGAAMSSLGNSFSAAGGMGMGYLMQNRANQQGGTTNPYTNANGGASQMGQMRAAFGNE
jgi:hypothetical protein